MDMGIIDHGIQKAEESMKLEHGKAHIDILSNDSHTGVKAHILKKKDHTKVDRMHYSVLATGKVVMGISSSIVAA